MAFFLSLAIETQLHTSFTKKIGALKSSVVFLLFFCLSPDSFSQLDNSSLLFNNDVDTTKESQFFFKFQNLNFLKNNEYAGPMADGYTLFGYQLNP